MWPCPPSPSPASAPARTCPAAPCPSPAAPPWFSAHGSRSSALPAPRMGMGKINALPALSWTLSHVPPSDGRDLPLFSFLCLPVWGAEQHHQVPNQCSHPPTLGHQGWQSWDCTGTHTHTHTPSPERTEPLTHATHSKTCSRLGSLSAVETPSLNGYFPPW